MNSFPSYKGYKAIVGGNENGLYGKVAGISDLVLFELKGEVDFESEFHSAVDDYISTCKAIGKEPNRPL